MYKVVERDLWSLFQILPVIAEHIPICTDILELCALRFVYIMFNAEQEKTANINSLASPTLLDWLSEKVCSDVIFQHHNQSLICIIFFIQDYSSLIAKEVPLADTNRLLLHAVKGLIDSPSLYRLADELYNLTANIC